MFSQDFNIEREKMIIPVEFDEQGSVDYSDSVVNISKIGSVILECYNICGIHVNDDTEDIEVLYSLFETLPQSISLTMERKRA